MSVKASNSRERGRERAMHGLLYAYYKQQKPALNMPSARQHRQRTRAS